MTRSEAWNEGNWNVRKMKYIAFLATWLYNERASLDQAIQIILQLIYNFHTNHLDSAVLHTRRCIQCESSYTLH